MPCDTMVNRVPVALTESKFPIRFERMVGS
jgi:hypothetical protein